MKSIHRLYDEFVRRNSSRVLQSIEKCQVAYKDQNCLFGNQIVPTFYKPYFISPKEHKELSHIVPILLNMLEKAVAAYFKYPELRPLYGIPERIRRYVEIDPGYKSNIVISRPDAFVENGIHRFIEFNCDSPAGAGYTDLQEKVFRKEWIYKKIIKPFTLKTSGRLRYLLDAILKAYREYGGKKKFPNIAIIDWKYVRTQGEFLILKEYFESLGYPTQIFDPRELKLRRGKMECRGFKIDLIYRRVIIRELMEHHDEVKPLLRAYALNKVCIVNSLRTRLASTKSILSILTNPAYNYLFNDNEIQVRDRHIPWTRLVVDGKKFYGGKSIYLAQMIEENREDLVLKPADGYGGRDVQIGRETSKAKWRRTLTRALRGGEHWVVQEYVNIPEMTVPVVLKRKVRLIKKKVNINPYCFGGKYAGALARLSDAFVINVSKGGGLIPSIAYRRRMK